MKMQTLIYDAGKDNLSEISGYEHLVCSGNFI